MSKLGNFQKKYDNKDFVSSCSETPEWKSFAASFKRALSGDAKETSFEVTDFNKGHFYLSGFLRHQNGQYVYWSISDVRGGFNARQILYRTAKSDKDFTGGQNHYTSLERLLTSCEKLANIVD